MQAPLAVKVDIALATAVVDQTRPTAPLTARRRRRVPETSRRAPSASRRAPSASCREPSANRWAPAPSPSWVRDLCAISLDFDKRRH